MRRDALTIQRLRNEAQVKIGVPRISLRLNLRLLGRFERWADLPHRSCYGPAAMPRTEPSMRKLAGIALILLLIVLWAVFVASLAPIVGRWPIIVQAPYYLFMGIAWIIPLKPLVRWTESGSFRTRS